MRIPLFNRRGFFAQTGAVGAWAAPQDGEPRVLFTPPGVAIVTLLMVPGEEPTTARRIKEVLEYGPWTAPERPARTLTELASAVGMDPGAGGLVAHYRPGAVN
jgi:hypothetical protein